MPEMDICEYERMPKSVPVLDTVDCCAPLTREPLSAEEAEQVTRLLKTPADPVRLLSSVASHSGGAALVYYRARTDTLAGLATLIGTP